MLSVIFYHEQTLQSLHKLIHGKKSDVHCLVSLKNVFETPSFSYLRGLYLIVHLCNFLLVVCILAEIL
jgi:hypothetical protein